MSSQYKSVPWLGIALAVVFILFVVVISTPNLLRSRTAADKAARLARARTLATASLGSSDQQDQQKDQMGTQPFLEDRKIVQTALLDLVVASVEVTASRIQGLVAAAGGYIEKSEVLQNEPGQHSASMVIRVPAGEVAGIRDDIKKLAQKVVSDKSEARDVTPEFVDSEARLRNMKVEEAQYLELMHRSSSTKDIIDITSRLSDVRGRIEQLTGELRYLSHQVGMWLITVTLASEYIPNDSLDWHPFRHARAAFHEMVESMTEYADFMVSFVLFVPVLLLWSITVIAGLILSWKILRWLWLRFIRRNPAPEPSTQP